MFRPITTISSLPCVLPAPDVDTDRIIPARFLTTTERTGLGAHLFADWRAQDTDVDRTLTAARAARAELLVAGPNFGCGSSREHAVWSLADFGFRAVITSSFADIFHQNALRNGLVPARVSQADHAALLRMSRCVLTLDLGARVITEPGGSRWHFELPDFECDCLGKGWDSLDFLLEQSPSITAYEGRVV